MRGVAAIAVMIFHLTLPSQILTFGGHELFRASYLAVDLFFILSGFVIYHSYAAKLSGALSPQDYVLKRIIRIYPMYLVGLLIGAAGLLLMIRVGAAEISLKSLIAGTIFNMSGLPYPNFDTTANFGVLPPKRGELFPANPPAWSLFFEMVASVYFLFVYNKGQDDLKKICLSALVVFLGLSAVFSVAGRLGEFSLNLGWGTGNFIVGVPRVIFGFTVGIYLYKGLQAGAFEKLARFKSIGHAGLYAAILAALIMPVAAGGLYSILFICVIAPALVIIGAGVRPTGAAERVSDILGWMSYPVYCLHLPVGRIVYIAGSHMGLPTLAVQAASFALTLAAAYAVGRYVDEPLRNWLSGKTFAARQG